MAKWNVALSTTEPYKTPSALTSAPVNFVGETVTTFAPTNVPSCLKIGQNVFCPLALVVT